jgi:hypothetical protein
MKYKAIIIIGVLIQIYYVFSWIYPYNMDLTYENQQEKYLEFWPFFSNSYHPVIFVFLVSLGLIFLMVYILATSKSTLNKKIFLIAECLFTALIGWSLL